MKLGKRGENLAARLYKKEGYRILCRNYSNRHGEVDVIAIKKGLLVFCEVKTRRSLMYGKPFEAITEEKQKRIRRLAEGFIANKRIDFCSVRFDAVSILVGNKLEISHIKNAF